MAVIDPQREDYTNGDDGGEGYLMIQAAGDTGTVQYKLQNARVSDCPGIRICSHKLMAAIHCIAWFFFSLQQVKTFNSRFDTSKQQST